MFSTFSSEALRRMRDHYASDVEAEFARPQDPKHGDLTTTAALRLSKLLSRPPREIAEEIAAMLREMPEVEGADVAGAGYVNIRLKPDVLLAELDIVTDATKAKKPQKKDKPVIIEYSQPNIAKPLAIHHIIGTVLGQSMVNLYRHQGANVISWNYIGDWGTQFGKLAVAYEKWGGKKPVAGYTLDELLKLYVRFHEEVKTDESLDDQGREAFRKLEQGDKTLRAFWKDVVAVTKSSLEDIYLRLGVTFDLDLGESFYEDKMEPVLEEGKKKGVFTEGEGGSLIVAFPEEKNMSPYLVLKGDGATLYSTRDLAQMKYRIQTYDPKEVLIFTDIAQKLHFEQLVETCTMLGWKLPAFENVLFGRMRFVDKSMSTRKGNVLELEHVVDEAVHRAEEIVKERGDAIQTDDPKELAEMMGVGALVYGILSQNRKMDIVFDWDKMLSFEGNSAPYLQYTHARARSVLRKAENEEPSAPKTVPVFTEHDRILLTTLLQFPAAIESARSEHMPHKLATFLHQLAQDFNRFYNVEPILQADEPTRTLRLFLTFLTAQVLKTGAALLTMRVPDRM